MNNITTQNDNSLIICTCPHCNSASITRSGFDRGTQRFRCKNCSRTFKETAGTPVHGLHKKDKITKYIEALRVGMSVRKAAQYVGISKNTSFAWRHKFLSSLEARTDVHVVSSIASAEIIQLEYSAKGRRQPPEKQTSPTRTIAILREGQLELHKLIPLKHSRNASRIFSESSARFFAIPAHRTLTEGIKHAENAMKVKHRHINQPLITNLKRQISKLLCWMERFKGVASKYLQNYWNWYARLQNLSQLKEETGYFCRLCTNRRSLTKYLATKKQ